LIEPGLEWMLIELGPEWMLKNSVLLKGTASAVP
jgi:hypothetical protein